MSSLESASFRDAYATCVDRFYALSLNDVQRLPEEERVPATHIVEVRKTIVPLFSYFPPTCLKVIMAYSAFQDSCYLYNELANMFWHGYGSVPKNHLLTSTYCGEILLHHNPKAAFFITVEILLPSYRQEQDPEKKRTLRYIMKVALLKINPIALGVHERFHHHHRLYVLHADDNDHEAAEEQFIQAEAACFETFVPKVPLPPLPTTSDLSQSSSVDLEARKKIIGSVLDEAKATKVAIAVIESGTIQSSDDVTLPYGLSLIKQPLKLQWCIKYVGPYFQSPRVFRRIELIKQQHNSNALFKLMQALLFAGVIPNSHVKEDPVRAFSLIADAQKLKPNLSGIDYVLGCIFQKLSLDETCPDCQEFSQIAAARYFARSRVHFMINS